MSNIPIKTPAEWRNFGTRIPLKACRIQREDLKLLYRLIDERQVEYRNKIVAMQLQQPAENQEHFEARKLRVHEAHVTSVTIAAKTGELLTGNAEQIFDAVSYWPDIKSIFFSTKSVPQAIINATPSDSITAFLDFTQPPALDFSKVPTLPTINESNFEIQAVDEAWFVISRTRLTEFFEQRKAGYDWIHAAGVYDLLLIMAGLPLAVWGTVKVGSIIPSIDNLDTFPRSLIYCYTFFLSISVFRVVFSYARWVFPKIEVEVSGRQSPLRHRGAWGTAATALFWPAIYDIIKCVGSYFIQK